MNKIIQNECIDNHLYTLTHYFDTKECYNLVENASKTYWSKAPKIIGKENYEFGEAATFRGLGPMLLNHKFHHGYTVLEIDNKPWSFGGIRKYNEEVSLVLGRHFSFFTIRPITHGLLLPFHLKISKELGYKKAWVTINDYNLHWYKTWHINEFGKKRKNKRVNILYTNSDNCVSSCKNLGKMKIYSTDQTILEWEL